MELVKRKFQSIRSTTKIWAETRHQYGISALVTQTSFCEGSSGNIVKPWLFSQANVLAKQNIFLINITHCQHHCSWEDTEQHVFQERHRHLQNPAGHKKITMSKRTVQYLQCSIFHGNLTTRSLKFYASYKLNLETTPSHAKDKQKTVITCQNPKLFWNQY